MNGCLQCKYAKWARTKSGRVNPHQAGECTWSKTIHVPSSSGHAVPSGLPVLLTGGYIWRKRPKEKCPTFQPQETA